MAGISQPQVDAYALASGDDNPLHRDPEIARRAGLDRIPVPGLLLLAQIAEYLCRWPRCAAVSALSARFVGPVFVGDGVEIDGRVVAVDEAAVLTLRVTVRVGRQLAIVGEAIVRPRPA